jgi:hypothetical protein
MVNFVVALQARFHFDLPEFVVFLERIWDGNQSDRRVLEFMVPIFLGTFADKGFDIEGDFEVFGQITNMILAEEAELDYPQLCAYYVAMHDNEVPFEHFDQDAALVFVNFLMQNTRVVVEKGFPQDLLKNMHRSMKQIFKTNKRCLRVVERHFENNPTALYRIKQLAKSPELREF